MAEIDKSDQTAASSWAFGILFMLMGAGFPDETTTIVLITLGVVLIPPVQKRIQEKTGFALTAKHRRNAIIGGFLVTLLAISFLPQQQSAREQAGFWERFLADYHGQ